MNERMEMKKKVSVARSSNQRVKSENLENFGRDGLRSQLTFKSVGWATYPANHGQESILG